MRKARENIILISLVILGVFIFGIFPFFWYDLLTHTRNSFDLTVLISNNTNGTLDITLRLWNDKNVEIYNKSHESNGWEHYRTNKLGGKGNYVAEAFVDTNRTLMKNVRIDEFNGEIHFTVVEAEIRFTQARV